MGWRGGQHSITVSILAVAELNQHRWLEESGQGLKNVDQTHLVGKCQASTTKKIYPNVYSRRRLGNDVSVITPVSLLKLNYR